MNQAYLDDDLLELAHSIKIIQLLTKLLWNKNK